MQFKKEEIIAYLDTDRSVTLEVELGKEQIVFLHKYAEELSKECGLTVCIEDAIGLILKAFVDEHQSAV